MASSQRLLSVINDILDFSTINLGQLSLNISAFSVEEVLNQIADTYRIQAMKQGIEFKIVNLKENQTEIARGKLFYNDVERFKQVVSNLLSNAFRFTKHGFVYIKYEFKKIILEDMILQITVEDSGSGIQEDMIAKLFEIFGKIQERDYKNLNTEGMGLGLAICNKLLSVMNDNNKQESQINVSSTVGKGSKFSFEIKSLNSGHRMFGSQSNYHLQLDEKMVEDQRVDTIAHYDLSNARCPRLETDTEFIQKRKKKILIVDDDPVNIMVIKRYLSSNSEIESFSASNGLEAFMKIEEGTPPFDLVLMDCNMPVMDGFEATLKIRDLIERKVISDVPIIAVTANVLPSDLQKCLDCGMTDYLTKPLYKTSFFEKLNKYLF